VLSNNNHRHNAQNKISQLSEEEKQLQEQA